MLKNFLFKQMLKSQLKSVPKEQQDKVLKAVEKNPKLFQEIAEQIQEEMKNGTTDQMQAAMKVMQKHQSALKELL